MAASFQCTPPEFLFKASAGYTQELEKKHTGQRSVMNYISNNRSLKKQLKLLVV
jgi:hypothetical protein